MGYVSIVPEVRGFASQLQQHITGPSRQAGQDGGEEAGEGFTSKMGGALKAGLVGVAVAAAALLTKGFMDALDQSAITGKIQASLGSTPQDAARYGKAAGQLYARGVTDNVEEAAGALSGVMRSGILPPDATNKQIESITGKVTDLSKTFELDLGQTSNAVGQMLKSGLAKDGTEALDILTAGMQKMGPRADDMADTFNEYSTKFRDLGLSAADAMGLMSQGMQAGARDTDVVADALKEFQIRATDGSKTSTEAYQAIGLNAEKMTAKIAKGGPSARAGLQQVIDALKGVKDPAARSQAAVGLFGTKAEDLGKALFALDPSTAVKALGDTAGAADKMGTALHDNAGARVAQFKRSLEVGLTNFMGDNVIPAFTRFSGFLSTTFGPILSAGKTLVSGFFGAFSTGAGGASLTGIAQTLMGLGASIRDAFGPSISALVTQVQTGLLPALQGIWNVVFTQLVPALSSLVSTVASAVVPIVTSLGRIMTEVIWPAVLRVYTAIAENLKPILSALSDFISARVSPAVQMIGEKLRSVVDKARPLIEVVTAVVSWLGQLGARIAGVAIPVLLRLAGPVFSALFSSLGGAISGVGDFLGWLGRMASGIASAGRAVVDFSKASIRKFGEFIDWVGGLPGRVVKAVGDFRSLLVEKGRDLARGILDGIRSMGAWLGHELKSWATSVIPGPIAHALGINSPSTLMRDEIGRWLPPGIVEGIDDEQHTLDARLRSMVTVPDIGPLGASGPVSVPRDQSTAERALSAIQRLLEADQGREIVVRVGEQEIARAVASGQRQLARR